MSVDRSEIRVGQVLFFTEKGIKRYGNLLSNIPLTVIEVEPEWYEGSIDVHVRFTFPSDHGPRTLWIHSSCVWYGENCLSDGAIDTFLSEF